MVEAFRVTKPRMCEDECRPEGSETLPRGIMAKTSDLEMHPLWGPPNKKILILSLCFSIMMASWMNGDLEWISTAINISAINQTKWWFAKRFLHPNIVAEYAYIFLWDEDLGVENFNAGR